MVSETGDLANWMSPQRGVGNIGGAMDLAVGAKRVIVATEHTTRDGQSKIVNKCSYPLTAKGCVDLIVSDLAVIEVTRRGLVLKEVAPGWSPDEVQALTEPKLLVAQMSGGQRQMVACARAIAFQSKILIMDEPTAALGVKEANTLLGLIEGLKEQGLSIILITQRIPDVLAIGDRVMVLKGGERQGVLNVAQSSLDDIVSLIIKGRAYYDGTIEEDIDVEHLVVG